MDITFLGTSSGTPTRSRNVSGLIVSLEARREWVLIDCGEGTQHQLLRGPYSLRKLEAILITHVHGDHCYGLPGLLASAVMAGRSEPLTLVGPPPIWPFIQAVMQHTCLEPGFELRFVPLSGAPLALQAAGLDITACPLSHRVPCWGFRLSEARVERKLRIDRLEADGVPAGPLWEQLQKGRSMVSDDGRVLDGEYYSTPARQTRAVVVGGDNDRPELLRAFCEQVDLLVHEATYSEAVAQRLGPEPQHSSAAQVARFASEVELPALVLTHFSARYRKDGEGEQALETLRTEAQRHYAGELFLADDLERYRIHRDHRVSVEQLSPSRGR